MKRFVFILLFVFWTLASWATHYAITGTSWGAGALLSWAASSGGVGTLNDPTATDDVIFDGNSPNVVCSGSPVGLSLTTTGYTGTISGAISMNISGSIILSATTTMTVAEFRIIGAGGTLTANGASISSTVRPNASAGNTVSLGGAFVTTGVFAVTTGDFNTNNHNLTCESFVSNNPVARVITLGSSVITITGASATVWNIDATNLTFNAGTSTIKFTNTTNTGLTFVGAGITYYDVWFDRGASTGSITITGANTFNDFKDTGTAAHTIIFPNVTTTVTTFSVSGNSGALITLARTGASGTWTISQASGVVDRNYLSISNSVATGGATWNAGAGSTDGGGNTGWVFTQYAGTRYAVTGTTWGAGGNTWAATSGGMATITDPTAADAVVLNANSTNVVCSGSPVGLSLTTTGYSGTISGAINITLSGDMTLSSTTTITVTTIFFNATATFTANSATLSCAIVSNQGSVSLGGPFTTTGLVYINSSNSFTTNNHNIICSGFASFSTGTWNLGSSVIEITGAISINTFRILGGTINAGTSVIKFTNTSNDALSFIGGGKTYYDVWFDRGASTGTITITGTNTFNSFRYNNGSAARTIIFPNVTTTIAAGGLLLGGASGNLLTLARTGGSGTMTISVASGTICLNYLSISNSTATGGASFYAGANSTDGGGNTGWTFTACPGTNTSNFFFKP